MNSSVRPIVSIKNELKLLQKLSYKFIKIIVFNVKFLHFIVRQVKIDA